MEKIYFNQIKNLNISPLNYINFVKKCFIRKNNCVLPKKISIKYYNDGFINIMPSVIPFENVYGVKIVSRNEHNIPTIKGDICLFDLNTNNLISVLDGTYITAMRTSAVAALTLKTLSIPNYKTVALMGLGNVGRCFIQCLPYVIGKKHIVLKLLKYKNHQNDVKKFLKKYKNIEVKIYDDMKSFIIDSDVVISCITYADKNLADPSWFKPGCLLIPVHTRGFQNCDTVFDKVFCDDVNHISNFSNFSKFKSLNELGDVLNKKVKGRENNKERILAYNIGISIHDIYIANYIYEKYFNKNKAKTVNKKIKKYWVF